MAVGSAETNANIDWLKGKKALEEIQNLNPYADEQEGSDDAESMANSETSDEDEPLYSLPQAEFSQEQLDSIDADVNNCLENAAVRTEFLTEQVIAPMQHQAQALQALSEGLRSSGNPDNMRIASDIDDALEAAVKAIATNSYIYAWSAGTNREEPNASALEDAKLLLGLEHSSRERIPMDGEDPSVDNPQNVSRILRVIDPFGGDGSRKANASSGKKGLPLEDLPDVNSLDSLSNAFTALEHGAGSVFSGYRTTLSEMSAQVSAREAVAEANANKKFYQKKEQLPEAPDQKTIDATLAEYDRVRDSGQQELQLPRLKVQKLKEAMESDLAKA